MRRPLLLQLLVPVIGLALLAVAANVVFAAWLAVRRTSELQAARQQQVATVLAESSFPVTQTILEKLNALTSDEFVVWNTETGVRTASTQRVQDLDVATLQSAPATITLPDGVSTYRVLTRPLRTPSPMRIAVLTPMDVVRQAALAAIWPLVVVGLMSLGVIVPLLTWFARRTARRLATVEAQVERISSGEFGLQADLGRHDDEITRLTGSINSMSHQLQSLHQQLTRTERARLVGQLAAGFAHQLRNGIAGARLAVQLHRRRCAGPADDASLAAALQQLELVEEEVRSLLSLGREEAHPPSEFDLSDIARDVVRLIQPACEHARIELTTDWPTAPVLMTGQREPLRGACLNLALNGLEAAGPGGRLRVGVLRENGSLRFQVDDSGPGPTGDVSGSLFEPFVTTKPEGVGLGLVVAQSVARQHHGEIAWRRVGDRTRFELRLHRPTAQEINP